MIFFSSISVNQQDFSVRWCQYIALPRAGWISFACISCSTMAARSVRTNRRQRPHFYP